MKKFYENLSEEQFKMRYMNYQQQQLNSNFPNNPFNYSNFLLEQYANGIKSPEKNILLNHGSNSTNTINNNNNNNNSVPPLDYVLYNIARMTENYNSFNGSTNSSLSTQQQNTSNNSTDSSISPTKTSPNQIFGYAANSNSNNNSPSSKLINPAAILNKNFYSFLESINRNDSNN